MGESKDASEGEVWLYNPDLEKVGTWEISSLQCLNHDNECDGLHAVYQEGHDTRHALLVPVPVSMMDEGGTYRFVVHIKDDHAERYRDHQERWALELNAVTYPGAVYVWIDGKNGIHSEENLLAAVDWNRVRLSLEVALWTPTRQLPRVRIWTESPTCGIDDQRYMSAYFGTVYFKRPNGNQRAAQQLWAAQNRVQTRRTVVVTVKTDREGDPTFDKIAGIKPAPGERFSQTKCDTRDLGEHVALCVINYGMLFDMYPSDEVARKNAFTNTVIHELTHLCLNDSDHCTSQASAQCVFHSSFLACFAENLCVHDLAFHLGGQLGYLYDVPWCKLEDVNKMRQAMQYPLLQP